MSVKWLFGYRKLRCDKTGGVRILNIMMRNNIEYWGLKRGEEDEYEFFLIEKDYKKLSSLLDKYQMKVYSVKGRGLPFTCKAHKNRIGLLVGMVLFAIILLLSTLFVWDIKVVSETDISHNEILANLKTLGCYEGSFAPNIDFEDLCIDYINKYKDCSWISVNLKGTVAYVEIQDKRIYDELNQTPRNLVASHGGIIEDYAVYSGKSNVKSGNVVKKGDLLVSGIVDSKHGAVRLCRADAKVNAIVEETLDIEVFYNYKKQVYTGKKYESNSLRFFNFVIPLNRVDTNEKSNYTHSYENVGAVIFDDIELPLSIEKEVFCEYKLQEFTYTQMQAEELALMRLGKLIDEEFPNAEILNITTKGEHSEDRYLLECKIKCRLDIAAPVDIKN